MVYFDIVVTSGLELERVMTTRPFKFLRKVLCEQRIVETFGPPTTYKPFTIVLFTIEVAYTNINRSSLLPYLTDSET